MKKSHYWPLIILSATAVAIVLASDVPRHLYEYFHRRAALKSIHRFSDQWAPDAAVTRTAQKITAITLERTGCFGSCPVYRLRLERGGNAVYEGRSYVPRLGRFKSRIYFDPFAYFAAQHLLSLKDSYFAGVTCQSTTLLTIDTVDGKKVISDYADSGPNDLLIFCSALDGVAATADWIPDNPPASPTPPAAGHSATAHP